MRKKGWKKRVASAVLAAAMVVSQIGVWNLGMGVEAVKAEEINYITNGDFEDSTEEATAWTIETDSSNITSLIPNDWGNASEGGTNILVIKNEASEGSAAENFSIKQSISNLSAGNYTFSFACKGDWAEVYPIWGGTVVTEEKKEHDSWEWTTYSFDFTVTENQTEYVIGIKS